MDFAMAALKKGFRDYKVSLKKIKILFLKLQKSLQSFISVGRETRS
jgi:hypothetical protein